MSEHSNIRVTPSIGEFADVEPGMVFVIPFTIHNVSNRVKRVRFGPPKTSAFRLISAQQSIAPGMKQSIEVEFSSKEVQEVHDTLVVRTEEGQITIPLHAWFPAPNIVFDPVINLGRVSAQHPVESKRLKMRNIGKKDGLFKFIVEPHLQNLSLTPQQGIIPVGQEVEVAVHYFAADVGLFRGIVNLHIEGQPVRRIEVQADIVESRVGILHAKTNESLSRLSFGKLFFGQEREAHILLKNYGKHTVSFTVRPPEDTGGSAEEESHQTIMPLECEPTEGRIAGNGTTVLKYRFAPTLVESHRGWEHSSVASDSLAREWDVPFGIEIVETEQKLDLQILGRALPTQVRLSESFFRFADCPVNDHNDILFSFTNESAELPISFQLSRVAHFRCEPMSGILDPKGQQNVLITFHPNQLGSFKGTIYLSINGNAKKFPITVSGNAVNIGPKTPLVGGVDKIKEDFVRPRKFTRPSTQPTSVVEELDSDEEDDEDEDHNP